MLLVLLLAPLLTGFVRKVKARLLRRQGPRSFQPYRDLARLLRKDALVAHNASWLFRAVPYLIFATTWVAAALVPTFADRSVVQLVGAISIAIIALSGQRALLSGARRHGYRHQLRRHRVEPRGHDRLAGRARDADDHVHARADRRLDAALHHGRGTCSTPQVGLRVSLGLALVALIIVAIAENARIPVDNPATHLELTMVHEAMVLEYSGRHLALIELTAGAQADALHVADRLRVRAAGARRTATRRRRDRARRRRPMWPSFAVGGFALAVLETVVAKMRVFRVAGTFSAPP